MNKKTNFKTAISYALGFFLSFFIFCAAVLLILGSMCSPIFCKAAVKNSGYIEHSIKEISEKLSSIAIPGGFPEDFFEYGMETETIEKNIYAFIENSYKNEEYKADASGISKEIEEKIFEYAEKNAPDYSDETAKHLKEMADMCVNEYMSYATPKIIGYLGNYTGRLSRLGFIAGFVCIALSMAALWSLFGLKAKNKVYIISLSGLCLMLSVFPLWVFLFGGIDKLGIMSKSLMGIVGFFIKTPLIIMTALSLAFGLIIAVLIYKSRKKEAEL